MPSTKKPKRVVGGSATERGMDFQARVSAIVMAHLIAEQPMGWLKDILDDTPLELDAETGGPGDDVRFLTKDRKRVELQAKRGLERDKRLWEALLPLAKGIADDCMDAGILAVCPNSSRTVKEELAEDIRRLGTGRTDNLRDIGRDFSEQLTAASLDIRVVCSRLRIVVINAVDGNEDSQSAARGHLARITPNTEAAWRSLVDLGRQLIRLRTKATPEQMYQKLFLDGVSLKKDEIKTRIQLQEAVREWLQKTYAQLPILGLHQKVPFDDCWISLDACLLEDGPTEHKELDEALKHYHECAYQRRTSGKCFDSHTIGRFIHKCVVRGGPGIGKTTLLKKLALEYSRDGFLTLFVKLHRVVALFNQGGRRFEDCLVEVALSSSGIRIPSSISLNGAVVLCDGLDECGSQQSLVTEALHAFSEAHPRTRIVVSSRPIGYHLNEIADWRLYELQPLEGHEAKEAISKILRALPFASEELRGKAITLACERLQAQQTNWSPLMLTLMAVLFARGIVPGNSKAELYAQLFKLIEEDPSLRLGRNPPSKPERERFLELLGWSLLSHGNEPEKQTLERCAQCWSKETNLFLLESKTKVQECFEYWECLGVVERVRALGKEAITFVHKTFGEFAAARYLSQCKPEDQQAFIAHAIQKFEWREALSFASHLGLAPFILETCAKFAAARDSEAGYKMVSAIELVVQPGVPIEKTVIENFATCCWQAIANSTSKIRYATGEALCIVSKAYWPDIRHDALKRLDAPDNWTKLVAWTCLSMSPEQDIPLEKLAAVLRDFRKLLPQNSFLGRSYPSPMGMLQHLFLSAAKRMKQKGFEPEKLKVLQSLFARPSWLTGGTTRELERLGVKPPPTPGREQLENTDLMSLSNDTFNRAVVYLLKFFDDSSVEIEISPDEDSAHFWELGAFLGASAIGFLEMHWDAIRELSVTEKAVSKECMTQRRMVMHRIAEAAGLDKKKLIGQAKAYHRRILDGKAQWGFLSDLPRVDVEMKLKVAGYETDKISELENVILGEEEFFSWSAGNLLRGLCHHPRYVEAIERLLEKGHDEAMKISASLAGSLPAELGQPLLLKRLCFGELTSGCCYLFKQLKPPFDARHENATLRGLEGNLVQEAKAAADFATKLPLSLKLAEPLRTCFDKWKTKEEPYPKKGGFVPDSPRDALAKILSTFFAEDDEFLLGLAKDDRPNVCATAKEPISKAAASSPSLRKKLILETKLNALKPEFLRAAISAGCYSQEEALEVVQLLQSNIAAVRYAALPILDTKYFPAEFVHRESSLLLSDNDMEIREAAGRILSALSEAEHNT